MGNSYGKNMTGWNDGPTPYGCANTQDNLSIITSVNGFGYRTDDFQDVMNSSAYTPNSTSFSINGIITTSTDKDVFRFNIASLSTIHIDAVPYAVGGSNIGADLDVKILMYSENQTLIKTFDPATSMSVTIDTLLKPGIYYFVLDGTGNTNATNDGSLGSYTINGFRSALPIHDVTLTGTVAKNKHQLSWNIISDEPVRSAEVEMSNDGILFNTINTVAATSRNFSNTSFDNAIKYYRVKATSVTDQVVYSNVIALRSFETEVKAFTISTFVTQQLSVQAAENFQYKLMDMNGRTLAVGKGNKGYNLIDMNNRVAGMYVIQLFGLTQKQSERFIKQ